MIDLALRAPDILIDLEDESVPDLKMRMRTLSDSEAGQLMSKSVSAADGDVDVNLPIGEMMGLFRKKVMAFEGDEVNIAGQPFDPSESGHVDALPLGWKIKAVGGLISYATSLPEDVAKNS